MVCVETPVPEMVIDAILGDDVGFAWAVKVIVVFPVPVVLLVDNHV